MLDDLVIRVLSRTIPVLLPVPVLHRAALAAASRGRHADAERLFETAARGYRHSLEVEALARLRVQQRMVRARATGDPVREAEMMLEIVRGLNRLDRLESFTAPHELKDAREVLSEWLSGSEEAFAASAEEVRLTA